MASDTPANAERRDARRRDRAASRSRADVAAAHEAAETAVAAAVTAMRNPPEPG
ncbi:hypothetical protein [Sphingomonas suaedae]|uniref:hypothetical protein n=1 Tax=Sphingomonas suaedae TaxID=2599297 RepID=UPI00164869CF|nr:hypothetical protein [Sphingomonas suaedae]